VALVHDCATAKAGDKAIGDLPYKMSWKLLKYKSLKAKGSCQIPQRIL
jgi:hypothetical protein